MVSFGNFCLKIDLFPNVPISIRAYDQLCGSLTTCHALFQFDSGTLNVVNVN